MESKEFHFDEDGRLVKGTYVRSKESFINQFCTETEARAQFYKPFIDICEWAEDAGATSIVVGGSFVGIKPNPSDIDVLIFFANAADIPKSIESFYVDGTILDIQLLSEDQPAIVSAFLDLLATERMGVKHGLVQIKFHGQVQTHLLSSNRSELFEVVKSAYLGRKHAQLSKTRGLVIPIHGIRTFADWLPQFTFTLSSSGWSVAPYVYGYKEATILASENEKKAVVEGFRDWLANIRESYDGPISIVAHSFGTYVVGRYIEEAGDLLENFASIILCGSILNTEYDWAKHLNSYKVGAVMNTISEEDEWVKFMPDGGYGYLVKDKLFGNAGRVGFVQEHQALTQVGSRLLQHNNIFKSDVIRGTWLPFLELNKDSNMRRYYQDMFSGARPWPQS